MFTFSDMLRIYESYFVFQSLSLL